MNWEHQRDNVQGALIVVLLFAVVIGGLVFGGGYFFWMRARSAEITALRAETLARQEAELARAQAQVLQSQQIAAPHKLAQSFKIEIDFNGDLRVDGQPSDLAQLQEFLKTNPQGSDPVCISLHADDRCTIGELKPIIELCESWGDVEFKFDSPNSSD